jgi:F0F1-type ATP synthase membrane subunit b/b'
MSIRLIARDLYRLIRKVSDLEKQIDDALMERQEELTDELRKAKAERDHLRQVLDGSKESLTKSYR